MEIAHAQIQRPEKGEDALMLRRLEGPETRFLLAVADGLSLQAGAAAAQWVTDYLERAQIPDDIRAIYRSLQSALASVRGQYSESETTLTCGILRELAEGEETFLRFDFFAIGDSPIWKVVPGSGRYPFQRSAIHGAPYPGETAKVYATVRLHDGDIKGFVNFGSVDIRLGEVLVVCSDGIPEREVFVRDPARLQANSGEAEKGLCSWLFDDTPFRDGSLAELLTAYDRRGVLFDDATLIAARPTRAPVETLPVAEHLSDGLDAPTHSSHDAPSPAVVAVTPSSDPPPTELMEVPEHASGTDESAPQSESPSQAPDGPAAVDAQQPESSNEMTSEAPRDRSAAVGESNVDAMTSVDAGPGHEAVRPAITACPPGTSPSRKSRPKKKHPRRSKT